MNYPTHEELKEMSRLASHEQDPYDYTTAFAIRIIDWHNSQLAKQEPVAWRYKITTPYWTYSGTAPSRSFAGDAWDRWDVTPLYSAPIPPNHIPAATKLISDDAWQLIPSADHCGLIRFMSQRQYDLQPDNIKKWYQPYRCPACVDNDALKAKLIECRPSVKADLIRWEQFLLRKAGACNQCDHDETQRVHELLTAIDALKGGAA